MHQPTTALQLPFQFDTKKLVAEVTQLLEGKWMPHFNTGGYSGNWNVIPLYAPGGDATNIFAHATRNETIAETDILNNCIYLKEVIGTFQCPVVTARLLRLGVGATIKPHTDHALGYEDGTFRLHIPILTNPDVQFILDGTKLVMSPGSCWYTNVNFVHSVANNGTTDRIHLVLDLSRNDWSDQLFFSLAPAESFLPPPPPAESPETLARMIEELQHHDATANKALIETITKR